MTTKSFTAAVLFEPLDESLRFLPEGPRVLRHDPGKLGWIAIQHAADSREGSLNILDLATRANRSIALPGRPGFFAETRRPGIVLIGLDRRLVLCDLRSGSIKDLGVTVSGDERVIINDGMAVEGGVLFGTKHLAFDQPVANLYFFDTESRALRTLLDGQTCSNGKVIIGGMLIDIDSTPKAITKYKLEGRFERATKLSLVKPASELPGYPDGMRPVDDHSVVVAFYNPDRVPDGLAQQLSLATGEVLCEWRIPGSPRVTCPEFAEIEGNTRLIFTTAVEGMPSELRAIAPNAGCLFVADVPPGWKTPPPPPLVNL